MLATTKSERPSLRGSSDGRPCKTCQSCTERSPRRDGHADHVSEHRRPNLDADAGQKPDQRRARQKVGEKAKLENAGENRRPEVSSATMPTSAI